MEPWEFHAAVVKFEGIPLLRMTHRGGLPLQADKPFIDLDTSFELSTKLERPELRAKAETFIHSLGFRFPLPLRAEIAQLILSFRGFPDYAQWEKLHPGYPNSDFLFDLMLFWLNRGTYTSYEIYLRSLAQGYRNAFGHFNPQDQSAYARSMLRRHPMVMEKISRLCGVNPLAEKFDSLIKKIESLGTAHMPEKKENKKKMAAQADSTEKAAKKGKKKETIDRQERLW